MKLIPLKHKKLNYKSDSRKTTHNRTCFECDYNFVSYSHNSKICSEECKKQRINRSHKKYARNKYGCPPKNKRRSPLSEKHRNNVKAKLKHALKPTQPIPFLHSTPLLTLDGVCIPSEGNKRNRKKIEQRTNDRTITNQAINNMLIDQFGLCNICDCNIETNFHRDHIRPLTKGGSHTIKNIQLLCPNCNMIKSNSWDG